jgi:dephospho-CoA kinase
MKCIGLTGGIGSGKSRVASILSSLHYPVYHADARAKALMTDSPTLVAQVKALFGEEAYQADGTLNRALIGQLVFNDEAQLQRLNAIVHPATGRDFTRWAAEQAAAGHQLAFEEAAILFESGAHQRVDLVWAIYAPKTTRLARAMQRDQAAEAAILSRMDRQWPETAKIARADFVLFNDGQHHLIPQVRAALARALSH